MKQIARLPLDVMGRILTLLPSGALQTLLIRTASRHARTQSPAEGLRFLFDLDTALYHVQGELARKYGDGVHTKHRHMKYHDFFVNRIQPNERVIDIGCGIGAVAHSMAERSEAIVYGVDISKENIATAKRRHAHPNITYVIGDVLQEGILPHEIFDVVVLSNVLEHLPNRSQFLQRVHAMTQVKRMLIRVPLFERDWRVPLKKELGIEWRLDPTHEIEYMLDEFADEMVAAGLTIVHQEVHWGEVWAEVQPK